MALHIEHLIEQGCIRAAQRKRARLARKSLLIELAIAEHAQHTAEHLIAGADRAVMARKYGEYRAARNP